MNNSNNYLEFYRKGGQYHFEYSLWDQREGSIQIGIKNNLGTNILEVLKTLDLKCIQKRTISKITIKSKRQNKNLPVIGSELEKIAKHLNTQISHKFKAEYRKN